jgi:16S rRNA (guanine527-N7)-methyltransferase
VSDPNALDIQLGAGLHALGLALDAGARAKLIDYVGLLERWNATYNLTAVREPSEMITRHLLDSLAIAPFVTGSTLADLGTGPGLPGVPLAIADPQRRVFLVEANGKKARFLREVVRRLPLPNATVVEARAEGAQPAARVDCVVARAVAAIPVLASLAEHWLLPGGVLLAMKGPDFADEQRGLPAGWQIDATHRITVPGLDAGRFLVVLKQAVPKQAEPG